MHFEKKCNLVDDNTRVDWIKLNSKAHDFGLVQRVSTTRSHPYYIVLYLLIASILFHICSPECICIA